MLTSTLDRLDTYKEKIPIVNAAEFLPALIDISDDLPEGDGSFMLTPFIHATRIAYWYLRLEQSAERRGQLLLESFNRASGMALIASLISSDDARRKKEESEQQLTDDNSRKLLRTAWLTRIRAMSAHPAGLLGNSSLAHILFRWLEWGHMSEVTQWAEQTFTSPKAALRLVVALTARGTSQGIGDRVAKVFWRLNLESLEKIVPPELVERSLGMLDVNRLSSEENRAVEAFNVALARRRAGKTGDPIFDLE